MRLLNYHITMNVVSGYMSDTQRLTPPHSLYRYLIFLFLPAVFALISCEKSDLISDNPAPTLTKAVSQEQLLGDWNIESAVIPVGSFTADIAWDGSRLEISRDSLRFHRHDLVYPASYPGETTDVTLATYPYNIADNYLFIGRKSFKIKPNPDTPSVTLTSDSWGVIVLSKKQ